MGKFNFADLIKLLASIIVCQLAGIIGSIFTAQSIPTWYSTLQKPSFNPPNAVFAPVWIALYLLMGLSLFIVWRKGLNEPAARIAALIFFIQLLLNVLWSFLFFGLRSPFAGFVEIVILWIFILLTIIFFYRISRFAGLLLMPYIAWVSFALVLNLFLWKLNS